MKERMNITLEKSSIKILEKVKRQRETVMASEISFSSIIEFAIRKAYSKPLEFYRDKMRFHQQQLMIYKELREAEETKDNTAELEQEIKVQTG